MGCSLGPDRKMETDQIILTEQVSILRPSLLVSTIPRETERQTETERNRQRQRWRESETEREGDRERPQCARTVVCRPGDAGRWRGPRKRACLLIPWTCLEHLHLSTEPCPPRGFQAMDRQTSKSELRTGITRVQ